jgi:hypothetical protein
LNARLGHLLSAILWMSPYNINCHVIISYYDCILWIYFYPNYIIWNFALPLIFLPVISRNPFSLPAIFHFATSQSTIFGNYCPKFSRSKYVSILKRIFAPSMF